MYREQLSLIPLAFHVNGLPRSQQAKSTARFLRNFLRFSS